MKRGIMRGSPLQSGLLGQESQMGILGEVDQNLQSILCLKNVKES